MPTQINSAGITFNDATSITSANIGNSQIINGAVTVDKLGTNEKKQICKAWVNFNGTTSPGTIRSSYNVSSVTRIATGRYSVNFTTPMTDANYSVSGSCEAIFALDDATGSPFGLSSVLINTGSATALTNETYINASIFGN
jgi:hypothetical protein